MAQLFFRFFAGGDVVHQAQQTFFSINFDYFRRIEPDDNASRFSPEADFQVTYLFSFCQHLEHHGPVFRVLPDVELQRRPIDHLVAPVAQYPFKSLVDLLILPVCQGGDDENARRRLKGREELVLRFPERFFHLFAPGNVVRHLGESAQPPAFIV